MATLHMVNRSSALAACLAVAADEDAVLLIEDGVYATLRAPVRPLHAIEDDIRARGLTSRVDVAITRIGYAEMVELTVKHQPIVSWN